MYKILLDDGFYDKVVENRNYLNEVMDFFNNFLNIEYVIFHPFGHSDKTLHQASYAALIDKKILATHRVKKLDYNKVKELSDTDFVNIEFEDIFIGKIAFVKKMFSNTSLIIPLTLEKHCHDIKTSKNFIYYINHYSKELDSNITKWIIEDKLIHIQFSSKDNVFPAHSICGGYNDLRTEIIQSFKNDGTKTSQFERIGTEVALRNRFTHDVRLSTINERKSKSKRKIFKSLGPYLAYLSIDFENGGFELYDKNAKHLGQYKFNGEFEKDSKGRPHPLYLN